MSEPRTYPLRVGRMTRLLIPVLLVVFTVVALAVPFLPTTASNAPPPPFVAVVWLGILGFLWYQVLSLPLSIVLRADETLEFRSLARKRVVAIRDLQVIEPVPNQLGFFRFRHSGGRVVALLQFDGTHDLLSRIAEANPNVRLLGC